MIEWVVTRLLGGLCPVCEERYRDLDRHWVVSHVWF